MNEPRFDLLTESERQCLRLALTRQGSKDIAPLVGLTHHTVDKRFKSATRKLGVASRFEAARMLADHERDQSPDPLDQAPDVASTLHSLMIGPSFNRTGRHHETAASDGFREEQARFFSPSPVQPTFRMPVRQHSGGGNDLDVWQRIGWVVGITLLFAIAFGVLSSGLTSLGVIVRTVSSHAS